MNEHQSPPKNLTFTEAACAMMQGEKISRPSLAGYLYYKGKDFFLIFNDKEIKLSDSNIIYFESLCRNDWLIMSANW